MKKCKPVLGTYLTSLVLKKEKKTKDILYLLKYVVGEYNFISQARAMTATFFLKIFYVVVNMLLTLKQFPSS